MITKALVNGVSRLWLKPLWAGIPSVNRVRRKYLFADRLAAFGRKTSPVQEEDIEGARVEWIGQQAKASRGLIIYLHGGGFAVRAALTDRRFCSVLSKRTGLPIILVAYRLAPEYPYPEGLNDCGRVYEALLNRGVPADRIVLIGHSAGANYALVLLMRAKLSGVPQPAGAILLSPPTDLTANSPSAIYNAEKDTMQGPTIWPWVQQAYLKNTSPNHPEVSPLFGDWLGLARLHFHVSDTEIIFDDSRRAVEKALAHGVDAKISIWRNLPHNFYFIDLLSEARECHQQIASFIAEVMASSQKQGESPLDS